MKNKILVKLILCTISSIAITSCGGENSSNPNSSEPIHQNVEYTTSFETNGGTPVEAMVGTITYSPITTKEGYEFTAWCSDSNLYQAVSFPFTPTKNTTLYAKWEKQAKPVERIELDRESGAVYPGIDLQLHATIYPYDADDKTLTWTTSNPNVAAVKDGIVRYSGKGSTTITATSSNGKKAQCLVTAGKLVTIQQTSGSLTRDDGVKGSYSNVRWSDEQVSFDGKVSGTLSFTFTSYAGSGTRGGIYFYFKSRSQSRNQEIWFQFGMITANNPIQCIKEVTLVPSDFYTVIIGSDGRWFKY